MYLLVMHLVYPSLKCKAMRKTFFPYFCVSRKTKQIFFHIRIFTRKNTVVLYSRKFRETDAEVNAELEFTKMTRSTEPLYEKIENNDYNRHFRPKNVAAVNRPPSIGRRHRTIFCFSLKKRSFFIKKRSFFI